MNKNRWNDLQGCEHPICDTDEAVPVWVVVNGEVVEAWYRNPIMNTCWFESDTGVIIEANLWIEQLAVDEKPVYQPYGE